MPAFGVEVEDSPIAWDFFNQSNQRLKEKSILKNPFFGSITKIPYSEPHTYVVIMEPVYPKVYYVGVVVGGFVFVLTGFVFTWWLIAPFLFLASGLFWSKFFLYFMIKFALRKKNYRGYVRLLDTSVLVERLVGAIA